MVQQEKWVATWILITKCKEGENFEKATEFVVDFSSEDPEPVDHESALVHSTTLHTSRAANVLIPILH